MSSFNPTMPARSYLFVPGDRPARFAKAMSSGADAVVVDLEDAVAEDAKAAARATLAQWLPTLNGTWRARVLVRINAPGSPNFVDDLALLAAVRPAAVMLPKAEHAQTLAQVQQACPDVVLLPLIETAIGMLSSLALASAPGVQRLVFGTLDYSNELELGPEPWALDAGHAQLALVSRAAGIAAPVAGVTPAITDAAQLLADWQRARGHGFGAKLCIHPQQVAPLHASMTPSPAELDWAQRVLVAVRSSGGGAVQLDGRMVDKPVIVRAERLMQRAAP